MTTRPPTANGDMTGTDIIGSAQLITAKDASERVKSNNVLTILIIVTASIGWRMG